jgi:chloramphenicol 3-O-phosphotransferase
MTSPLRVAVVGPCMSGKSELVQALREAGYQTHHVAQEHSYVPHMWRHLRQPDVLIYLDVDYEAVQARRPGISWGPERLVEQAGRLAHARAHCDLYIDTSKLTIAEVRRQALDFLTTLQPES